MKCSKLLSTAWKQAPYTIKYTVPVTWHFAIAHDVSNAQNSSLSMHIFLCCLFVHSFVYHSFSIFNNIPSSKVPSLPMLLVLLLRWADVVVVVVKTGCGVGFFLFDLEDFGSDDFSSLSFTSLHKFTSMLLWKELATSLSQIFEELSKDVSAARPFLSDDSAARPFFFPLLPPTLLEVADFRSMESCKHNPHPWLKTAVKTEVWKLGIQFAKGIQITTQELWQAVNPRQAIQLLVIQALQH